VNDNVVRVPYVPRAEFMPFHQRSQRFACMVAHRRAGKTVACVNEAIHRAIYSKRKRPRYAYIGPLLKQAKKIAWEYLKEYTTGLEKKKPSESELTVVMRHNDAEISIYGADNPDGFRGQYFDGVILDEYGDMSPSLWGSVILPTLADRDGWAAFIGTFKGRNHFYRVFRNSQGLDLTASQKEMLKEDPDYFKKRWFNFLLSIDNSNILSAEAKAIQRAEMDDEQWEQEYRCNPDATVKGTYYMRMITDLMQKGQIYSSAAEWNPEQEVNVAFDLGKADSTAAWFWQPRFDGIAIIDYLQADGKELDYYFTELDERNYRYGTIWLPHDAKAKTLATRRSVIEQFLDIKDVSGNQKYPIRIAPKLEIKDGIAAVRKILPSCFFNPKTENGVECLRAYKRTFNEDTKAFSDTPDHDWSSHGADAFRYFALVADPAKIPDQEEKRVVVPSTKIQLEVLFQERERRIRTLRGRV
jgi:phage terminase large subunit